MLLSTDQTKLTVTSSQSPAPVAPRSMREDAELRRRAECPIPCGYSKQLCCAANEICYTAPNSWAECSPTALPRQDTTTVTANSTSMHTSVVYTLTITTLTSSGTNWTSPITRTSVKTTTEIYEAPAANSSNSTNTTLAGDEHGWWTTAKEGAIGAVVGLAFISLIVLGLWLVRRRRKRNEQANKAGFDDQQSDATETYRLHNSAHVRNGSTRNLFAKQSIRSLRPRERPPMKGLNPYEHPSSYNATPWGPDNVAPPYPGSRSNTPNPPFDNAQRGASGVHPENYSDPAHTEGTPYDNVASPYIGQTRIPRRPVRGMQPTVQEYYDDHD